MTSCPWCADTGLLHIIAERDHAPWHTTWRDVDTWSPCHNCPAGRELAGIEREARGLVD